MNCFLYEKCNHIDCDKPFCLRKTKLSILYDNALISERQRKPIKISLDANNELDIKDAQSFKRLSEISNNICKFVDNGNNLFIHSRISGNGKTSWSLEMISKYFNCIWSRSDTTCRALFISVPKLLIEYKNSIRNPDNQYISHIEENILTADLVVFDDIAAKVGSEYEINQLLNLIDNRINLGKSNIYTSNLNSVEMMTALGSRLTSRICNMSEDIELFGVDKRSWSINREV